MNDVAFGFAPPFGGLFYLRWFFSFLSLDEAIAYKAVFVMVSGSTGGLAGGNAFGAR